MAIMVIVNYTFEKNRKKNPKQLERLRWGKAWQ